MVVFLEFDEIVNKCFLQVEVPISDSIEYFILTYRIVESDEAIDLTRPI